MTTSSTRKSLCKYTYRQPVLWGLSYTLLVSACASEEQSFSTGEAFKPRTESLDQSIPGQQSAMATNEVSTPPSNPGSEPTTQPTETQPSSIVTAADVVSSSVWNESTVTTTEPQSEGTIEAGLTSEAEQPLDPMALDLEPTPIPLTQELQPDPTATPMEPEATPMPTPMPKDPEPTPVPLEPGPTPLPTPAPTSTPTPLDPETTPEATPTPMATPVPTPSPTPTPITTNTLERVRGICASEWIKMGVSEELALTPIEETVQNIDLSSNANGVVVYRDDTESINDEFILVTLSASNINGAIAELRNSKGWYCFYLGTKNANGFTFKKYQSTNLLVIDFDFQNANNVKTEILPYP